MSLDLQNLEIIPKKFPFPFDPYPIQHDFMRNLFFCLEKEKLGIFESPTGTGKSLSLICGALTWLRDHNEKTKDQLVTSLKELDLKSDQVHPSTKSGSEPAWLQVAKENHELQQKKFEVKRKLSRIEEKEKEYEKLKAKVKKIKESLKSDLLAEQKQRAGKLTKAKETELDNEDIPEDLVEYNSDNDYDSHDEDVENDSEFQEDAVKIIFASRTHSQLVQFVREVKRSPFGSDVKVCTLASRQQLCINPQVNRLKNSHSINEKCLDIKRKSGSRATRVSTEGQVLKKKREPHSSCTFYNEHRVHNVRDISLVDIADIENLVDLGKEYSACPYYASRGSLPSADLLVVPYTTLLHKPTRESCGIRLKNSVVIIDEAHNLLDTISAIHSVVINGAALSHAHSQLLQYQQKFNSRFSAKTLLYVKQVVFVLARLSKTLLDVKVSDPGQEEVIMSVNDFLVSAGIDHINLHKIIHFCEKSKLPHKLMHFKVEAQVAADPTRGLKNLLNKSKPEGNQAGIPAEQNQDPLSGSPLFSILDFLRVLIGTPSDGRILCLRKPRPSQSYLKFLLLNPAALFEDFVQQPRSVVVAGGTMQPLWEFKFQLFGAAGAQEDRIHSFSCGHVIPSHHVLPLVLTKGPSGQSLDFSFAKRSAAMNELSQLTLNLVQVVPGGFVVFFPSYDFEQQVFDNWNKTGFLEKLQKKKKVFREPKKSSEVDQLLKDYATAIRLTAGNSTGQTGAILLSVVGGKLSEGINFSDDLARCVLMVGMPYPNSKSAELNEKINYLNKTQNRLVEDGRTPGQLYYESLCMKAVNQSIGRAIRHRGDYAALVLADARYARPAVQKALPTWIAQNVIVQDNFGPALANIRKFLVNLKNS